MSSLFAASDGTGLLIAAVLMGWGFIKMCQFAIKADKGGHVKNAAKEAIRGVIFKRRR